MRKKEKKKEEKKTTREKGVIYWNLVEEEARTLIPLRSTGDIRSLLFSSAERRNKKKKESEANAR